MSDKFIRTALLFGNEKMNILKNSHVAVFGIGGVGGHCAEALIRSGIGKLDLIDSDRVCVSNLNRQIIATVNSIGMYKTDAAKERFLQINPEAEINTFNVFYTPQTADLFDFSKYNYIVDAIDTVTGKLELIVNANKSQTPIISSMGAGNKINPDMFEVSDISKTSVCPLARVMRSELKKRGIKKLKVVYSKEKPLVPIKEIAETEEGYETGKRRQTPGSTAFVPSVAGLIIAAEIIKDLTNTKNN
ncbi:MAG: tRNA threonylcarbamoyladenosine dehydratase [Oscillospiraceae bacterium]|nr:tRNA threonylcarbamoyladenosine dehydratase [Oscillospiraceae bacterium]